MPKIKAKDMRPVPITWECRHKADEVLLPIINEVLGVEFDGEVEPAVDGVTLWVGPKYTGSAWGYRTCEDGWKGTTIQFYFHDISYCKVHRSLLIKPGADLDADKLREKWAEIRPLAAYDARYRAANTERKNAVKQRQMALLAEVQDMGEKGLFDSRRGNGWEAVARPLGSGFDVTLKGITPAQLRAIVAIVEGE